MKVCTKCSLNKELTEFGTRSRKGNLEIKPKSWCKECEKKSLHEWRVNNPDKYGKQHKINHIKRMDKLEKDPEYRKRINKQRNDSSKKNPACYIFTGAKGRAKRKNIEFTITLEDIIIPEFCPILGVKLVPGYKNNYRYSPSLDRIDNTKGYIPGNVAVISCMANSMKNSATKEQMILFIKNIQKYMKIKI